MAHFAQLNSENVVIHVTVVNNETIQNLAFPESEPIGIAFLKSLFGEQNIWKQTSYNNNFRKHYAGVGFTYDEVLDAFIPPKPFNSWVLNSVSCLWEAPTPMPEDGGPYRWDEATQSWVLIPTPGE